MTPCVTAGYFHIFCGLVLGLHTPAVRLWAAGYMLFDLHSYVFNMFIHTAHGMQEDLTPVCMHAAVWLCQPHLAICGEMVAVRCGPWNLIL